jgi:hypothetical protein
VRAQSPREVERMLASEKLFDDIRGRGYRHGWGDIGIGGSTGVRLDGGEAACYCTRRSRLRPLRRWIHNAGVHSVRMLFASEQSNVRVRGTNPTNDSQREGDLT